MNGDTIASEWRPLETASKAHSDSVSNQEVSLRSGTSTAVANIPVLIIYRKKHDYSHGYISMFRHRKKRLKTCKRQTVEESSPTFRLRESIRQNQCWKSICSGVERSDALMVRGNGMNGVITIVSLCINEYLLRYSIRLPPKPNAPLLELSECRPQSKQHKPLCSRVLNGRFNIELS